MQKRTIGIIVTVGTALLCGCASLFSCIFAFPIVSGQPIDVTVNGVTTPQILPPTIGYVLLCLSLFLILVPVVVGIITLRQKPEANDVVIPS